MTRTKELAEVVAAATPVKTNSNIRDPYLPGGAHLGKQ